MNFEILLKSAVKASLKAGCEIMKIYNGDLKKFNIETKSDNSPVTKADKIANKVIIQILAKMSIPVLSEEEKEIPYSVRKKWDYFWLVDPLDGTKEFIKHNDEFTVNIALIQKDTPIMGIIFAPVLNTIYFSYENNSYKKIIEPDYDFDNLDIKTFIDSSQLIKASKKGADYTIIASRSHQTEELKKFIEEKRAFYPMLKLISAGSSLKFCKMAEGSADIYPRIGYTMEWDTAAGHSICKSSGLKIYTHIDKKKLLYNKESLKNPYFIVEKTRKRDESTYHSSL